MLIQELCGADVTQTAKQAQHEHTFCVCSQINALMAQVGSVTNTFNVPGVQENCFFLKDMEGAKALRQRINECFEISALPSTSAEERKRLLTFVVVRAHSHLHPPTTSQVLQLHAETFFQNQQCCAGHISHV